MKIKDKHCVCKKWKEAYLEAVRSIIVHGDSEVMVAQRGGKRCPFCDRKLVEKERKAFIVIQFPPVFLDTPDWDVPDYYEERYVSLEELGRMLKGEEGEGYKV